MPTRGPTETAIPSEAFITHFQVLVRAGSEHEIGHGELDLPNDKNAEINDRPLFLGFM